MVARRPLLRLFSFFTSLARQEQCDDEALRARQVADTAVYIPNTRLYQYAQEQALLDPSIDFFVFGHQHKPMQYKTGDHAVTTVVGNWIYDFTFAVFDGDTVELRRFEEDRNGYKL